MTDLLMLHLVFSLAHGATNSAEDYVEAYDKKTTDIEDKEYTEVDITKQLETGDDSAEDYVEAYNKKTADMEDNEYTEVGLTDRLVVNGFFC